MNPWDVLADALEAADDMSDVNVYATATEVYEAPAVVVRPGEPWIEAAGGFPADTEHYVAIALVSASSAADGTTRLHRLVHTVADVARATGFLFESASEPILDAESGSPAIASALTFTYRNCEPEESN